MARVRRCVGLVGNYTGWIENFSFLAERQKGAEMLYIESCLEIGEQKFPKVIFLPVCLVFDKRQRENGCGYEEYLLPVLQEDALLLTKKPEGAVQFEVGLPETSPHIFMGTYGFSPIPGEEVYLSGFLTEEADRIALVSLLKGSEQHLLVGYEWHLPCGCARDLPWRGIAMDWPCEEHEPDTE